MRKKYWRYILLSVLFFSCSQEQAVQERPAEVLTEAAKRMPENALKGLTVAPGLKARLFAAEPMVKNPSNIDVDHRGRVWVVENVNYRPETNPDNPYQEEGDRVVILEDTDADGKADSRKVFFQDELVDGAMGIAVLDNRIYLSSSPNILILTDEDRDDVADHVDTLFTGIGEGQGDHTVHAVSFGPDGRLYFNFGNEGNKILNKDGSPAIDQRGNIVASTVTPYQQGMVFRCDLDGSNLETLAHNFRNNYEVCVDSYGRIWQSDNDDDGNKAVRINYILEYGNYGFKDELTGAAWQENRTGMHPEIPKRHWHQNDPGVIPNLLYTGSGSPCGLIVYEGDLLPQKFQGELIHADAGPGVVRAYPIMDNGAGFTARQEPMLVRKNDTWYRPTGLSVAPDGSLFVADWYDPGVGGHWAGDIQRGRIYRLAPTVDSYSLPEVSIDEATAATKALQSPNTATRYLAWTALEQMGTKAIPALEQLWQSDQPIFRARALWLLARLDIQYVQAALEDEDEQIRATAIRVMRQLYHKRLASTFQLLVNDSSPKVRSAMAIALREMDDPSTPRIWAALALQYDGQDRWYLEALGIGAKNNWEDCFTAWLEKVGNGWNTKAGHDIIWRSRSNQTLEYLIQLLSRPDVPALEQARYLRATDFLSNSDKDQQLAALIAMERQDKAAFQQMLLTHISPSYARTSSEIKAAVAGLLPSIRGTAAHLNIVKKLQLKEEIPYLMETAIAHPDHELGVTAGQVILELADWEPFAKAIKGPHQMEIITLLGLINRWPGKQLLREIATDNQAAMAARKKAIVALGIDWGWEERLTKLLEEEQLPDELTVVAANRLLASTRPIDRELGRKYLADTAEEEQNIAAVATLVAKEGNIAKGKEAFSTYCMSCHQIGYVGTQFGPDLSDIGSKLGKDALYTSIIYPDAAISHGYEGVHFELKNGTHFTGYILSENQEKVVLKVQNGTTETIAKANIQQDEALEQSLMTAGLARTMGEETLVDIVTYLTSLSDRETTAVNPYQGKVHFKRGEDALNK